jgi:hypothetical protein
VFIVKHHLPLHSYLAYQTDFVNETPDSPMSNKSTVFHVIKFCHDTGSVNDKKHSSSPSVLSDESVKSIYESLL